MNKKIFFAQVITLLIILIALVIYFAPKFNLNNEKQKAAKIKADNAIYTARVIEEFSKNKNAKSSDVAQKVAQELNKITKNPYDKKLVSYVFEQNCLGCNSISADDKNQMIVLTTYNKKGELIARTVIKPPSFVVYSKFDNEK